MAYTTLLLNLDVSFSTSKREQGEWKLYSLIVLLFQLWFLQNLKLFQNRLHVGIAF